MSEGHYAKLKDGTLVWVGPVNVERDYWKKRALAAEKRAAAAEAKIAEEKNG